MINRELIRLKVVQLVYAYYQNEGKTIEVAEKELMFSLNKAFDLYEYLLTLLVEIQEMAAQRMRAAGPAISVWEQNSKAKRPKDDWQPMRC